MEQTCIHYTKKENKNIFRLEAWNIVDGGI